MWIAITVVLIWLFLLSVVVCCLISDNQAMEKHLQNQEKVNEKLGEPITKDPNKYPNDPLAPPTNLKGTVVLSKEDAAELAKKVEEIY